MEQDYILSSRLCNDWDKDGAGIIYFCLNSRLFNDWDKGLWTLSRQSPV